ncbi:MAG TPA: HIT domain-containing protein [Candidatus Paceibacterota bacterium]|nr:HIT domain-containing protein [Candidatus Paceibacterota bacterium]
MIYKDYLKTVSECPFCAVKQRIIKENDRAYLTYSIAPYHPDHLLIVPKRHIEHILDVTSEEMADIDALVRKGLEALKSLGHTNMSVLAKEGDFTEKSIPHVHYHVIPDVLLETSDHLGAERRVMTEEEISSFLSRMSRVVS